ncbi:MAG: peptidase [Pararhodobacter sp.]
MSACVPVPCDAAARARLVALARGWIGTPYRHRASLRGVGCDCLGLILGVMRDWQGCAPARLPPYTPAWDEIAPREALWQGLSRHLAERAPASTWLPGQVVLFRMRSASVAKHLGLLSMVGPGARFIHAYGRHGTIESPLSGPWRARVVARFELI